VEPCYLLHLGRLQFCFEKLEVTNNVTSAIPYHSTELFMGVKCLTPKATGACIIKLSAVTFNISVL
jgi:hypothetical protein